MLLVTFSLTPQHISQRGTIHYRFGRGFQPPETSAKVSKGQACWPHYPRKLQNQPMLEPRCLDPPSTTNLVQNKRHFARGDGRSIPQPGGLMQCVSSTTWYEHMLESDYIQQYRGWHINQIPGFCRIHFPPKHFCPCMSLLEQISTLVERTAMEGWSKRGSIALDIRVILLLRGDIWLISQAHIQFSVSLIAGLEIDYSSAASHLFHLLYHVFIRHFCNNLPQLLPCRMCLLLCTVKLQLHRMLKTSRP